MWHLFVVLKVSSLIKKGLPSTCRVILIWKLALASRKSSSKNWRFMWEFIYQSLYSSILRESHNNHNSRTSSARNTDDFLEPQGLQSCNTNSSWQRGQKKLNKMRCKFTLICQILEIFFAKYFLARQFSMSRRQRISNKLMALQTWLLFFVIHTVLKFAYVLFLLLIVYWIVRCLVSRNVKSTRNNDSKVAIPVKSFDLLRRASSLQVRKEAQRFPSVR